MTLLMAALFLLVSGQSAPTSVTVLQRTPIELVLDESISTKDSVVGDVVAATVSKNFVVSGAVLLPAGTRVEGKIEQVVTADSNEFRRGYVMIGFSQITFSNGRTIQLTKPLRDLGPAKVRQNELLLLLGTSPKDPNARYAAVLANRISEDWR